jgi:hypothetical protein
MKRLFRILTSITATIIVTVIFGTLSLQAKEMTHRRGVGPKLPFSTGLAGIAMHYYPNPDYAVTGAFGINTVQNYSQFGLQGGIRRILFEEKNMNFFVGGALGLISQETAGNNQSGFEMMVTSGGEFFLQGLENLGINFEFGFGVASMKSTNSFYTVANSPVKAGFIFYF